MPFSVPKSAYYRPECLWNAIFRDGFARDCLLQRRVHCELAWTRWAHIREFLTQEWWSYLTRCAPTSRFLRVWLRCSRGRSLARLRPATAHLAKPHAQHPVSRAAPFWDETGRHILGAGLHQRDGPRRR